MKIDYPAPEEQKHAVKKITETALPREQSVFSLCAELRRSLGLRVIFSGMSDVIFLAAFCTAAAAAALFQNYSSPDANRESLYASLFTLSPALYLIFSMLGFWKERLGGAFGVKMCCRYTVCHLTVFRMLAFSCANMVSNLAVVALCWSAGFSTDFWQMLLVSASGLFLCSAALIYSLLPGGLLAPSLTAGCWVPVNLLLVAVFRDAYSTFLRSAPIYLHLLVTAALAAIYLSGLQNLLGRKRENVLC